MYTEQYDLATFFLYIIVALMGYYGFSVLKEHLIIDNYHCKNKIVNRRYYGFWWIFIPFVSLAVFRLVDVNIGGADTLAYKIAFDNSLSKIIQWNDILDGEFLFLILMKTIRFLIPSFRVFCLIVYGFIVVCYYSFVKEFCEQDEAMTPFVLAFFPYFKALCTMRSGIAVALFLLGLTTYHKQKRIVGLLLIISTFFFHRMSIIYILYVFYSFLFKNYLKRIGAIKWGIYCVIFIIVSYMVAIRLQVFIAELNILSNTDNWYLLKSANKSMLDRWPMFITQLILLILFLLFRNKISFSEKKTEVFIMCTFDFIILPSALVLGFWRANEFLYLARLLGWGMIISCFERSFTYKDKRIIRILSLLLFLAWLIYRIHQECFDLKLMPYIFSIF